MDSDLQSAKQCPWCARWALKNAACNWVCCGYADDGRFHVGAGCGRQWCFLCSKRLCGALFDAATGAQNPGVATVHSAACCGDGPDVCPGGHNSHK
jgi:hypothetical protein